MSQLDFYKTIKTPSEGEYKEKGSKFIAYAFEIESEDDFKLYIEEIKKLHFKARHHCFAYAIGPEHEKYRHNDDGEPSGTAGIPIYNQIKSFELSNIFVVVVRYFGGTKLGVPGLIRAYKSATKDAFENAEIITKYLTDRIVIKYEYQFTGDIMRIINNFDVSDIENTFDILPVIKLKIRKSKTQELVKTIYSAILNRDIKDIQDDEKVDGITIKIN